MTIGDGRTPEPGDGAEVSLAPGQALEERQRLRVRLQSFEGPLDLLLHLVRANEVDILDIPVAEIARQYDEHLELMRQMDLTVAGEFLVMAATLAYIKSRMLLPRPEPGVEGEEDPRHELARQLLEHERFRMAAESLGARADVQARLWVRPAGQQEDYRGEMLLEVTLFDLLRAFRTVLESVAVEPSLAVQAEGLSVEDRMAEVLDMLDRQGSLGLDALFPAEHRKRDRITTFLAILELLRLRLVTAWQGRRFGSLRIARAVSSAPGHPGERKRSEETDG